MFTEFNKTSSKAWKQKIQVDLKGREYNSSLLYKTELGIDVKPYYHADEYESVPVPETNEDYKIAQSFYVREDNITTINSLANTCLKEGVESLFFIVETVLDVDVLFKKLKGRGVEFHFNFSVLDSDFLIEMSRHLEDEICFFNIDILSNLEKTGNWYFSKQKDIKIVESVLSSIENKKHKLLGVDTGLYQQAGGNIVNQIAFGLNKAVEYIELYGVKAIDNLNFSFAVGGNYFFEISKLRAFRYLWQEVLNKYDIDYSMPSLFVQPSTRNKTISDYNVNMIRTTTECMSAILGGATTVCNISYDSVFDKKNSFGERISKNQLLILREESFFDKDISSSIKGTYYIESLTCSISEKALELFKKIEEKGGLLRNIFSVDIQKKIKESAQKEQKLYDDGDLLMIGSNIFENENENIKELVKLYPFAKYPTNTEVEAIVSKRLSEKRERKIIKKD
ncbi:MAG: methylmalonyl-CoA mutase [Flavobacteriaceae bacterium]|nr:methylmalonyl-CoA mutase [Flavobacteriaceae bacterium]